MALVSVVALVMAGTATASAASAAVAEAPQECQIVLAEAAVVDGRPVLPKEPIMSAECAGPGEKLAAPRASTLLMTWYSSYNYGGSSTKIYGSGGPCDSAGYGFPDMGTPEWNDRVRSWKVFNNCNYSAAWQHAVWGGYCHRYYSQVPDASYMDGGISSMWLSACCFAWDLCNDS
jgi:hypothetical protein